MPLDSLEFRISLQKLLAALIVILVPITVFGFYIGLRADKQVHQMNGAYFRTITRSAAATTSEFIGQRVTEASLIANEPSLVQAVTAANRSYERMGEAEIRAKADRIESNWNSSESDPLVKNILTSDLARWLRRCRELNPRLLKITVADEAGAILAATDKPMHYLHAEREYWQALDSERQGSIHISDVRYDEQSRSNYISIGFPVLQEGSGRFIGAVMVLVDVSPLFAYLNQQQIASTGRVFLIKDDGTVVSSPGVSPSMRVKAEEYSAIRDALGTLQGRETGYIDATLPHGETYLIGFADTGLKQAYPSLGWIVVATQDEREAFGPILSMAHFALLMMILGLLMLTLLGAYVFLHQKQQLSDLETPVEEGRSRGAAA
jgi:cache domain-containing protein